MSVCPSRFFVVDGERGLVPVAGMELDKMDENDWKYHGEGNKSLVVSHVQVTGRG